MGINNTYQAGSPGAIASYDYTDLDSGTGIVTYNGGVSEASGASVKYLDKNVFDCGTQVLTGGDYTRSNMNTAQTFSLSAFNLPKVIKGNFYTSFTTAYDNTNDCSWWVFIEVLQNSDVIASEYSETYADTVDAIRTHLVKIAIPQTKYKKGDVFSVRYTAIKVTGSSVIYLHHDPTNRDYGGTPGITASTNPTRLKIYIPFKINL